MIKFLISVFLAIAILTSPLLVLSAHAEEGEAANASEGGKKADKGDKKSGDKAEGEGGEGGGKSKLPEDVSGGRFAGDPVYVHLAPMVLPVITRSGAEQLVTLAIDVEVKDFDVADNIHANMPRVRDALMRALYGGLGDGSLRNGKLVDVTKIKNKAAAAISEVVGADGVRDVLIQGVAQRLL